MTEQQRTARIEFVKKLLVANGFREFGGFNLSEVKFVKEISIGYLIVSIFYNSIHIKTDMLFKVIAHDQSLKPLRDFIKLSNQPPNEQTS